MIQTIISGVIGKVADIIDQYVEDRDKALELKTKIEQEILSLERELIRSQRSIITAEARSESWLTRNWRPITMLTFVALIVADWLGFSAPNLTPELKSKLFDIIQIGLGGYVIGRSFEKVAREFREPAKEWFRKKRKPLVPEGDEDF
jgi:hypothetical protein